MGRPGSRRAKGAGRMAALRARHRDVRLVYLCDVARRADELHVARSEKAACGQMEKSGCVDAHHKLLALAAQGQPRR